MQRSGSNEQVHSKPSPQEGPGNYANPDERSASSNLSANAADEKPNMRQRKVVKETNNAAMIFIGSIVLSVAAVLARPQLVPSLFLAHPRVIAAVGTIMLISAIMLWKKTQKDSPAYILEFATWQKLPELMISNQDFVDRTRRSGYCSEETVQFIERLLASNKISETTCLPPGLVNYFPPIENIEFARKESIDIFRQTVDRLLQDAGVQASEIDCVVTNCSLFNPTPSIASMVAKEYGLREDVHTHHLSGMGCSSGLIALDLAKDYVRTHPGSLVLVFSHENITQNVYKGNQRAFHLGNTIFKCGGAAILVSSRPQDAPRARFQIDHLVRVTQAHNDESYQCVFETEDDKGYRGVRLSRSIVTVAGNAIAANLTILGPKILPWTEKLKFAYFNMFLRKLSKKIPKYNPSFTKAADFFCIHAGGRAVLDGVQKYVLKLTDEQMIPSTNTLFKMGNTSSSSVWYELDEIRKIGLKSGQRVLMFSFGSGMKTNTLVATSLRPY